VDPVGFEPTALRCCTSQRGDSNALLPLTRRLHHLSCCAGVAGGAGFEPAFPRPKLGGLPIGRTPTATVTRPGVEPGLPDRESSGLPTSTSRALRQAIPDTWTWADSNRRPPVCRTGALPAALQAHRSGPADTGGSGSFPGSPILGCRIYMPSTVELRENNSTERIQGTHGRQDSNLQPSVLETGALDR
jgi:hypothetical protein